ncbi:MAG: NVEALA domain-containing protein [Tannerellaceae bacterium]|nr:NVEALA domain-containing protein [Tannerellaceae bacterium]
MKKILFAFCIAVLCCLCFKKSSAKEQHEVSDLTLANIESLTQNEGTLGILCIGEGSIDCQGRKVKLVISGFR